MIIQGYSKINLIVSDAFPLSDQEIELISALPDRISFKDSTSDCSHLNTYTVNCVVEDPMQLNLKTLSFLKDGQQVLVKDSYE